MGVRVRLRIKCGDKVVEGTALVNTGYETTRPQLLVPYRFLKVNGIEFEDLGSPLTVEYETAGGVVALNVYRDVCQVSIITDHEITESVVTDMVVSPIEKEILISDTLAEELGIIILNPGKGYWRLRSDPLDKIRESPKPEYW